jgi:DNA-binding MarR family transcriptional regulator
MDIAAEASSLAGVKHAQPQSVDAHIDPPSRFASLLTQISERMNQRVAAMFDKSEGLKTVEVRILLSLARDQPRGIGHISRRNRIDKAWVSRTLRSLEAKGLVRIEDGDAPRSKLVSLTPEGTASAGRIVPALTAEWAQVMRGIDTELGTGMLQIVLANLERSQPIG